VILLNACFCLEVFPALLGEANISARYCDETRFYTYQCKRCGIEYAAYSEPGAKYGWQLGNRRWHGYKELWINSYNAQKTPSEVSSMIERFKKASANAQRKSRRAKW